MTIKKLKNVKKCKYGEFLRVFLLQKKNKKIFFAKYIDFFVERCYNGKVRAKKSVVVVLKKSKNEA